MAKKTYVPGLRLVLNAAYKFGTRYDSQLSASLTAPQYTCLKDVLIALASCLALLGKTPINP